MKESSAITLHVILADMAPTTMANDFAEDLLGMLFIGFTRQRGESAVPPWVHRR